MKEKMKTWWLKNNPEGVNNRDVFQVMVFGLCWCAFIYFIGTYGLCI